MSLGDRIRVAPTAPKPAERPPRGRVWLYAIAFGMLLIALWLQVKGNLHSRLRLVWWSIGLSIAAALVALASVLVPGRRRKAAPTSAHPDGKGAPTSPEPDDKAAATSAQPDGKTARPEPESNPESKPETEPKPDLREEPSPVDTPEPDSDEPPTDEPPTDEPEKPAT